MQQLNIAEVSYDSGSIRFRYARVLSVDGARWIRHGMFVEYGESGQVVSEGQYVRGKEHGVWKDFHPNGRLAAQGEYVEGQEHGLWRFWDEDGSEGESVSYVHGQASSPPFVPPAL